MEEKHDYAIYRTLWSNQGQFCEDKEYVGMVRAISSKEAKERAKCYYMCSGYKNKFSARRM